MESRTADDGKRVAIGGALRRHAVIVVAVILLGELAAGLFLYKRSPEYVATTKVLLNPIPGNALTTASTSNGQLVTVAMETEAGLVGSPAVEALAARKLGRGPTARCPPASRRTPR